MIPFALLACSAPPRTEIAYLGRYYFRPGLNKTSRYYVYGVDLHGGHRVRLSGQPVKPGTQVIWADRDTVAWNDRSSTWWLYDIRTGHRWSAHSPPKNRSEAWPVNGWEETGTVSYKRQPSVSWSGANYGEALVLTREGVSLKAAGSEGRALKIVPTLNPNRTLAVFWMGSANGMGDEDEVLLVDWKRRKVLPWHRHVKQTQFFPDRDLFLARHENRELIPYGYGGNVWGDRIYAGTMTGDKMWTVVGGTVWCGTPALRPR